MSSSKKPTWKEVLAPFNGRKFYESELSKIANENGLSENLEYPIKQGYLTVAGMSDRRKISVEENGQKQTKWVEDKRLRVTV
jgi:hypothetical protein